MPNLRIIFNNAADCATINASSSVGALVPDNLKNDLKSVVWRSSTAAAGTTPSARIDATWSAPELIAGVALAYSNLTPQAQMRVRGTGEAAATNIMAYSSTFGDSSWNKAAMNLAGGITAPDGGTGATAATATGADPYMHRGVSLAPGTYTLSVYLKGVGVTVGKAPLIWVWNQANLAGMSSTSDGRALTNGWVRYSAVLTVATGGTYQFRFDLPDAANVGDVVHVWGAQLEAGARATSYYPTGAAAATRPAGYMDDWQSYDLDSGWMIPCPVPTDQPAAALGANSFAYGGSGHARAWLATPAAVRALRIEITDAGNPGGYIEAARLVCGGYWEPAYNPDYGASMQPVDASKNFRNDAGDLMSDVGTRSDKLSISMSWLKPPDRAALLRILRGNGITRPVFASLFPNHADAALEQDHQILGKLIETPAMSLPSYNMAAATLQIESI